MYTEVGLIGNFLGAMITYDNTEIRLKNYLIIDKINITVDDLTKIKFLRNESEIKKGKYKMRSYASYLYVSNISIEHHLE